MSKENPNEFKIINKNERLKYRQTINELKQQLTEKGKEIERLKEYADYKFELPYGNVTILGKSIEDIQWLTNAWLKQGSNQLAIQELEKVKDTLKHFCNIHNDEYYGVKSQVKGIEQDVCDQINQQINELKGEKDVED